MNFAVVVEGFKIVLVVMIRVVSKIMKKKIYLVLWFLYGYIFRNGVIK